MHDSCRRPIPVADNPLEILALFACLAWPAQAFSQMLEKVGEVRLPGGQVSALAFSPDGRWLASGGEQGEVFLWDAERGERRAVLEVNDRSISELAFDADSTTLLVLDRHVSRWDLETGELVARYPARRSAMAQSPDGRWIACLRDNKVAVLLDVNSLEEVREFHTDDQYLKLGIAFSPDGRRLAIGSIHRATVYEFEVDTGKLIETRRAHGRMEDLAWPRQDLVITAVLDGHVNFGDLELRVGGRHSRTRISSSDDGSRIAIGTMQETAVLDAEGNRLQELGPCSAVAMHPDGRALAIAWDGEIAVHSGDRILFQQGGHYVAPDHMAFTGDAQYLAVTTRQGDLFFHDMHSSEVTRIQDFRARRIWGIFGYAEGSEILVDAKDDLAFWSPDLGLRIRRLTPSVSRPRSFVFRQRYSLSPDARWLVSGSVFHDLYSDLWPRPFEQDKPGGYAWTRDGRSLITAYTKYQTSCMTMDPPPIAGELRLFDLNGREMARKPYRANEGGNDISLTPDGEAVTVALGTRVGFFDPETLEELDSLPARARMWRNLDGDHGVSFGQDGLQLWDLRRRKPMQWLDRFFMPRGFETPPPELLPVYEMRVARDGLLALRSRDRILLYRLND